MGKLMQLDATSLSDLYHIRLMPLEDERGFFARTFCTEELKELLKNKNIKQTNHSLTRAKGSIRGMHFQKPPHEEIKIVRCIRGSVFDAAIDLRKNSPTFLKWHAEILSADKMNALFIPEGFAHGFQTLEENCEMIYMHTAAYDRQSESALRFDDPLISIKWPLPAADISKRDLSHPLINEAFQGIQL